MSKASTLDSMDYNGDADAAAFYRAVSEGRLQVKHCGACGHSHHYPRASCPFCFSRELEWRELPGTGSIYSFTVPRMASPGGYAVAYVALDGAGVSMLTHIVDCDLDRLQIGQPVHVIFRRSPAGQQVPLFTAFTD